MRDRSKSTEKWTAYESAGFKGEWGVNSDDPALAEAGDEIIVYPSLCKERACLIAAAPAMYKALQFADGYLDGHMAIEAAGLPSPAAHWETLLDEIRAALAIAEGR